MSQADATAWDLIDAPVEDPSTEVWTLTPATRNDHDDILIVTRRPVDEPAPVAGRGLADGPPA